MREPLKDRIRLEHILTAINNIFQYTDGKTIQQLNDEVRIPTVGTFYSHRGNVLFPPWERFIPTVGILTQGACDLLTDNQIVEAQ